MAEPIACPRCGHRSTVELAREGDLQRYQCLTCTENFSAPAAAADAAPAPVAAPSSFSTAHAPIAPPEPSAEGGKYCEKGCGKFYQRLGKFYDDHVRDCDGKPIVQPTRRAPRPASELGEGAKVAVVAPGTLRALDLSIDALKAQRSALEAEIRDINGAIGTLERIRGTGGVPAVPFVGGA